MARSNIPEAVMQCLDRKPPEGAARVRVTESGDRDGVSARLEGGRMSPSDRIRIESWMTMVEPGQTIRVFWLDESGGQLPGGCRRRVSAPTSLTRAKGHRVASGQVEGLPTLSLEEIEHGLASRPVAMLLVHNQQLHSQVVAMGAVNNELVRTMAESQSDMMGEMRRMLSQERQTDADLLARVFEAMGDQHTAEMEATAMAAEIRAKETSPDAAGELGKVLSDGRALMDAFRGGARASEVVPALVGRMADGDADAITHLRNGVAALPPERRAAFLAN